MELTVGTEVIGNWGQGIATNKGVIADSFGYDDHYKEYTYAVEFEKDEDDDPQIENLWFGPVAKKRPTNGSQIGVFVLKNYWS